MTFPKLAKENIYIFLVNRYMSTLLTESRTVTHVTTSRVT